MHALIVVCDLPMLGRFPVHEVVDLAAIMDEMVGKHRQELAGMMQSEMLHRIMVKLSLGERVAVNGLTLHRDLRIRLVAAALRQGAEVIYLMTGGILRDSNLRVGDAMGRTMIAEPSNLIFAQPPDLRSIADLMAQYRGVTVVADAHGMLMPLRNAVAWARSRQNLIWAVGDAIDYGAQSIETMTEIYRLVMRGEAVFQLGNHERKIARWLSQEDGNTARSEVKLSAGNRVTTDALARMSVSTRMAWVGRFRALIARSSLIGHISNVTLAHAAIHPDYWGAASPDYGAIETYALFGQMNEQVQPGAFEHSYTWVDHIPAGEIVMVGHDQRAAVPMTVSNQRGGTAIFLDTGSGKNGRLSTADLRFVENGQLRLECFNVH